jgi:hypothetical protein
VAAREGVQVTKDKPRERDRDWERSILILATLDE